MLMLQFALRTLVLTSSVLLSTGCSGDFVVKTGEKPGLDTGLAAYDAAGNGSNPSASVSATTQAAPGGDGFDAYAELPRAEVDFTMPTASQTITVKASGGDYTTLQNAWDALTASGRTAHTEIVIDAGYNPGPLNTGAQSGDDSYWVIIRSANSGSLPRHMRVGPADKADMPQITVPAGSPALDVGAGTKRVRFVGISTETGASSYTYNWLTDRDASYIIFDRCLADGAYRKGHQTRVGFGMYGDHIGVIDSRIHDINADGYESKAILVVWGSGPFGIVNNYLEASTINVLFGGVSLSSTDYLPHDITFARNYLYKNPDWVSDPNAVVKNLFEIKHGVRFLIEHNAFENSWADAQDFAILLKSVNQSRPGSGYSHHVTFRSNTVENFDSGINLAAQPNDYALYPLNYVSVHDNQFSNGGTSNPYNQQSSSKASAIFDDLAYLSFRNNDIRGSFNNGVVNEGDGKTDLVFEDNIIGTNNYVFQNGGSLDTMAPGHSMTGNIFGDGGWSTLPSGNCLTWPPPDASCPNAGIQTSRHASTKSGDFFADPWGS